MDAPSDVRSRPNAASARFRGAFKLLNRWLAVPVLESGLGAWIGTPVGGWLLLLRVTGRRSGRVRSVPLSYLVAEGSVWVAAGFGPRADWYQNILASPLVVAVLPGRRLECIAELVDDEPTRRRILPAYIRAVGAPALLGGLNPWHFTEADVVRAMANVPLVRVRPLAGPILAGPDDPGGRGWIWRQALIGLVALLLTLRLRSALGALHRWLDSAA